MTQYIAKEIQNLLTSHSFQTLACGGIVRDYLLQKKNSDVDLATIATPEQMIAIFQNKKIKYIETGLKHGTLTVFYKNQTVEITTLRQDVQTYGRKAKVEFIDSFEMDAKRRDFTINGMFMDLNNNKIYDFVGGVEDIKNKTLRFIGDPKERICEDYLRILRFFRFQSELGFHLDENSKKQCIHFIPYLFNISVERIRSEFFKLIIGDFVDKILFKNHELIFFIFPELKHCFEFEKFNSNSTCHVYTKICKGVSFLKKKKDPILSLAYLFHTIAQPICYQKNKDEIGSDPFYEYEIQSELIAKQICERLKLSRDDSKRIQYLVRHHRDLLFCQSVKEYRKFIILSNQQSNKTLDDLISIYEAQCHSDEIEKQKIVNFKSASKNLNLKDLKLKALKKQIQFLKKAFPFGVKSPLSGKEIMKIFQISSGKKVGEWQEYLIEKIMEGEFKFEDKETAIKCLQKQKEV